MSMHLKQQLLNSKDVAVYKLHTCMNLLPSASDNQPAKHSILINEHNQVSCCFSRRTGMCFIYGT